MPSNSDFQNTSREWRQLQSNMPSFVQIAVFLIVMALTAGVAALAASVNPIWGIGVAIAGFLFSFLLAASIKVANQWERGIVLRLGEFQSIRGPGLFFVIPVVDRVRVVDTRVLAQDIPRQEAITRDNVPVAINGALFFRVENVELAVMKIQDFTYAISLLAMTALRDVVGGMTLDELLSERERIGKKVQENVEAESKQWGLDVTGIRLQDIDMPEDLKKIMSRQASAEREKRATITKAEGDKLAADNLAAAAMTMAASPGAMQLRTLQTIDGLGPTASNTVILAVPIDILQLVQKYSKAT